MDISVIIISFNTIELTRNCLKSVYDKTIDVDFEVIVVDNNSHDNSIKMIETEFPKVKIVSNTENLGFGKANNQGIEKSNGKYVFLLNSDTILINNAIKILYDFMEKEANKDVACCGGALYNNDMTNQISYGRFPTIKSLLYYYTFSKIYPETYKNKYFMAGILINDLPLIVDYVTGADMLIRKSVLNKTGYFDKDFFLYFEETELCSRFIKGGYKNMIYPEAKIIHLCGQSPLNEKKEAIFTKSMYLYLSKHRGKFYTIFYKSLALFFKNTSFILKKIFNK
jgi:GT2 family glycosyltransferase